MEKKQLTKEECIKALDILKEQHDYLSFMLHSNYPYSIEMIKTVQSCFEQLINDYFDLVERIAPIYCKVAVDVNMAFHNPSIEGYVKQEIANNMAEFFLKENVIEFRKEEDYLKFQTVHKGKIYVLKPLDIQEVQND